MLAIIKKEFKIPFFNLKYAIKCANITKTKQLINLFAINIMSCNLFFYYSF